MSESDGGSFYDGVEENVDGDEGGSHSKRRRGWVTGDDAQDEDDDVEGDEEEDESDIEDNEDDDTGSHDVSAIEYMNHANINSGPGSSVDHAHAMYSNNMHQQQHIDQSQSIEKQRMEYAVIMSNSNNNSHDNSSSLRMVTVDDMMVRSNNTIGRMTYEDSHRMRTKASKRDQNWDTQFEALVAFVDKYGHCNVRTGFNYDSLQVFWRNRKQWNWHKQKYIHKYLYI